VLCGVINLMDMGNGWRGSGSEVCFRCYMPVDRSKAVDLMGKVKEAGYEGLWITVDTAV
jgi:isopentenyl diphosphate isomerase/L-lactate dehydrogenase-like FMN-dependent dehydrogenase